MTPTVLELPRDTGWTPEVLASLPADFKYEVREGNLVIMNAAMRFWHGQVQARLAHLLGPIAATEQGIVLGDDEIRVCDVAQFHQAPPGNKAFHNPSTVSLVVEIASPGSEREDRHVKPQLYAAAGIDEFWLVEETGAGQALVHRHVLQGEIYESAGDPVLLDDMEAAEG